MATSSGVSSDLIDQFLAVTGADRMVAVSLLEACAGNLELAVGMHMDGGGALPGPTMGQPSHSGAHGSSGHIPLVEDDDVRAPIPQRTETLVEDEPMRGHSWRMKRPRRFAPSVFDGFRDFQTEAQNFEDLPVRGKRVSKKRNLEDLFRPPVEITFKGTFENARDIGSSRNRWLLVNVQNVQEFPCQVLNRDVWSSLNVRKLMEQSFVFWQVYNDSEEGKRFMQLYKVRDWPYIAVIDPITGENQVEWNKIPDGKVFCELANSFLSMNPVPDATMGPSAAKKQKKEPTIVDATEDEQMEAAIRASLQPSSPTYVLLSDSDSGGDDNVETFSDPDEPTILSSNPSGSGSNGVTTAAAAIQQQHSSSSFSSSSSSSSSSPPSISAVTSKSKTTTTKNTNLISSQSTKGKSKKSSNSSHNGTASNSSTSRPKHSNNNTASHKQSSSLLSSSSLSSVTSSSSSLASSRRNKSAVKSSDNPQEPTVSDIQISHRDRMEAGSSGSGPTGEGQDSPLGSLMTELVGGRGAEVCTPDICTPDGGRSEGEEEEREEEKARDWTEFWGHHDDPKSRILFRFPDNIREQVELPCSSQVKALSVLCSARGYPSSKYELITAFPRRKLATLEADATLQGAGLHPMETVFVQELDV